MANGLAGLSDLCRVSALAQAPHTAPRQGKQEQVLLCKQHLLVFASKEQTGPGPRGLGFRIKGLPGPCGTAALPLAHSQRGQAALYSEGTQAPAQPSSLRVWGVRLPRGVGSNGEETAALGGVIRFGNCRRLRGGRRSQPRDYS